MSNLHTTMTAELYAVFIPSELQHCNFHSRTSLTLYNPVSHVHSPAFVKTQRNFPSYPRDAFVPMTTDYYLYGHGLPIIASCHLLRISHTVAPQMICGSTVTVIENIFTCGLLLLYLWEEQTGSNNNNTSLFVPGDTGKLGTSISVISVETPQKILRHMEQRVPTGLDPTDHLVS